MLTKIYNNNNWYQVKQNIAAIVADGHGSIDALKAAHDYLQQVNTSHGASRCTGQFTTRNYLPSQSFCNRYECWRCGDVRIHQDIERALTGMLSGDYGRYRTWYLVTVTYSDATRSTDTDALKVDFQTATQDILKAWRMAANRQGHTLRRFVFYGFKQSGQIHAHIVASWLPDAVLERHRYQHAVMSSRWLNSICSKSGMVAHVETVTDSIAVANYIKRNVKSTIHKMPYNAVRVSFSRSWANHHDALVSRLNIVTCQHCGQIAVDTSSRCHCGRSEWVQPSTLYITSETLPEPEFLLYKQTKPNETPFKVPLQHCPKCDTDYPLTTDYWYSDSSKPSKYSPVCKQCRKHEDAIRNKTLQRQFMRKASAANISMQNVLKGQISSITDVSTITANDVETVYDRADGHCEYCDAILNSDWQLDHFVPLSRQGHNTLDNLHAVCPGCNRKKSDMMPESWLASRGIVTDETPDWMPVQTELFKTDSTNNTNN